TGFGSRAPTTTRATPASTISSAQGGLDPQCAHGSSETYSVAPRARSPATASATASPCRPPGSVTPSATTWPSATTTAPTVGFGYARPAAARASSTARTMLMVDLRSNASRQGLDEPAVRAREILAVEDRRPGHQQADARCVQLADVAGADPAVDLDV